MAQEIYCPKCEWDPGPHDRWMCTEHDESLIPASPHVQRSTVMRAETDVPRADFAVMTCDPGASDHLAPSND